MGKYLLWGAAGWLGLGLVALYKEQSGLRIVAPGGGSMPAPLRPDFMNIVLRGPIGLVGSIAPGG